MLIACGGGILVGALVGGLAVLRNLLLPVFSSLYAVPIVILYPIFTAWFGIGSESKIAFAGVYGFFPVMLSTAAGIQTIDQSFLVAARSMGASLPQQTQGVVADADRDADQGTELVAAQDPEVAAGAGATGDAGTQAAAVWTGSTNWTNDSWTREENVILRLASVELDPTFVDPRDGKTVIPVVNKNLTDGVAKGGEASLTLTAVRWWRLVGSYTWLLLTLDPKGLDINRGALFARATPRNQVAVQSYLDLPARFQLDIFFRYASSVPAAAELVAGQDTPAYATFDVRLAWQALQHLDLSLVCRNLAQDHHREFPGASEVKRCRNQAGAGSRPRARCRALCATLN